MAARTNRQSTAPIPPAAMMDKGKKRRKTPRILVRALAFLLVGGSGWSWLISSQVEDSAPNQEDPQEEITPAPEPENKATEASEEAKRAPNSVEVTSAKDPTQIKAPSTATTQGTGFKQTPSSQGMVGSPSFTPASINNTVSLTPPSVLTLDTYSHVLPGMGDAAAGAMDDTLG